ncbi:DUF1189 domain-containing protein [Radiobacillus kanasensis]|uniref:DUF1189 family protein n=1 Tax=Radiobacillus kanasensis TaxID=2844358 RepID=UPI001E648F77|nr:DUF1189 family protein [Radiobacillus kanasensis]UFU01204.1 DUF1189 domain-containing protein [Radiobacillus kanasensis]
MQFIYILKNSLLLPRKEALFRLNRVSMRNTIVYIFFLMLLLHLPDIVGALMTIDENAEIPKEIFILNLIVSYPLLLILSTFLGVSILAAISLLLIIFLKRKLAYHYLWKITTYALTIPYMIYKLLLNNLELTGYLAEVISLSILYYIMYKIITIYPKKEGKRF